MYKVTRGLREHTLQSQQTLRAPRKMKIENEKTMLYLGFNHLLSTALATKIEPEASEVLHLPHSIIIMPKSTMTTISQNKILEHRPSSPGTGPATANDLQKHLSFRPTLANVLATCRHTDDKVSDVLHLSSKNHVPNHKMSTKSATKKKHCVSALIGAPFVA